MTHCNNHACMYHFQKKFQYFLNGSLKPKLSKASCFNCANFVILKIWEQFTYFKNFDQSGANNLPKYSRNVLIFDFIHQIAIRILQTKFETNRIKIKTFIVHQPKEGNGRTDANSSCFIKGAYKNKQKHTNNFSSNEVI